MVAFSIFETQLENKDDDLEPEDSVEEKEVEPVAEVENNDPEEVVAEAGMQYLRKEGDEDKEQNREGGEREDIGFTSTHG